MEKDPAGDFDRVLNRRESDSFKWHKYPADVLPMFVADMDFVSPPAIRKALQERVAHGCFGYAAAPETARATICSMLRENYGWIAELGWIVFLPGLVSAVAMAARMTARDGHKVIVPAPCYPPFTRAPEYMECETIRVPLRTDGSSNWSLDIAALDRAADAGGRLLILCNPYNPTGHVFRREELQAVAEWARIRKVTIVSDEIHCGLLLDEDLRHIPIASLNDDAAGRTITLMAPSKTYNVPGIGIGFAIIPDADLRRRFEREGEDIVPEPSLFGYTVCEAAYRDCEPWRQALLRYLRANRDLVGEALQPYAAQVRFNRPEATYLAWLNLSGTGWSDPAGELLRRGRVALGVGAEFHDPACARLNFGCPRSTLLEGLSRIVRALE